ncbi:MAG: hypothetical protein A2751_04350 [Candidatus Doudnabacteria bacterium RIFCSPHIGHO2_01_FULL_46_14]|uniref:D-alanine--D-alanine ligase n=1 Tax=Candidatus Doudnabacteria bacterium RIFCSPHIGHO2_01_FULL_46_14 TaxID=1817824 RepID=A0A1F5NNC8_9BACT|nr:MAG: hypothetical protein A2751_04350 [Candidatus Doudnabacteria bacterium RIFCSPHIGHO2_01_FULL_46_14]
MELQKSQNIGVFFGSRSPEHDISIITGELIISGLKGLGYIVSAVYIDKKGQWLIGEELGNIKHFTNLTPTLSSRGEGKFRQYYLDLEKSNGKLVFKKKGLAGKEIVIDLVFPAFHGANGEDGTAQGLFEMFNVPYVGCNVPSSAVAMDKILTKLFYKAQGIATTEFFNSTVQEWQADRRAVMTGVTSKLKWPMFVKPPLLGSSIGITKVKTEKELENAIDVALHYGNTVLVEEAVENLADITCCVIGNKEPIASLLQESVYTKELLSYEDKYYGGAQTGKSTKSLVIPAGIDEKITGEIRDLSVRIFKLLGCTGIARFDFLLNRQTGKYFANEINPLPGTVYHHLWEKSGVKLGELLQKLVDCAVEAHKERNQYTTVFDSDILKLAGSAKLKIKKSGE